MVKLTSLSWLAVVSAAVACSQGTTPPYDGAQLAPTGVQPGPQPSGPVPGATTPAPTGTVAPGVNPSPTGGPVSPTSNPPVGPGNPPPPNPPAPTLMPVETVTCQGDLPQQETSGATHALTAQFNNPVGQLPHFWTTYGLGRMGLYLSEEDLRSEHKAQDRSNHHGEKWSGLLKEHTLDAIENLELRSVRAHGLFHDDIGIYSEDESGNPQFDFSRSDKIFDFLVENDVKPIIELASMPSALATDPSRTVFDWKMIVSPPKSYDKWRQLVQAFVEHAVERYGADVANSWYYEVWNEPECCSGKFWGGSGTPATPQEYFQLYDASAQGVLAVLPNGRVGGPVTSQPQELFGGQWGERGAGHLFLDHITETEGSLGFFTFHTWSFLSGAIDGYFQGLGLLDERGFNNVPIAITEFGPTWEFGLRGVGMEPDWEPQETAQGAAFVAQVYSDISRRAAAEGKRFPIAYSWWTLSDVFDEGYDDPEDYVLEENPFIGAMGLLNREGIKKPAYNAYKFLAQLGDAQLPLTVQSPGGVNGLAARNSSGGVQVLVYNGQNPGQGFRDDTYYAVTDAQSVSVTIEGLDPEMAYDVTAYRVDATRGNAFAAWDAMGRPPMGQMDDAAWQTLRNSAESPAEALGQAVCGTSTKLNFELPSPGVLLVTLTPAVATP